MYVFFFQVNILLMQLAIVALFVDKPATVFQKY